MAIIEFKNYPDVSTPLSAENINDTFDGKLNKEMTNEKLYLRNNSNIVLVDSNDVETNLFESNKIKAELTKKQCLMAINSAMTITTADIVKIPLSEGVKVGNLLSINNGGIKVGKGIKTIKVSANFYVTNNTGINGQIIITLYKNATSIASYPTVTSGALNPYTRQTLNICDYYVNVIENDIIYLYTYNSNAGMGILNSISLSVEAVEYE